MLEKFYLAGAVAAFIAGWQLHSLVVDSETLVAERAAATAMQYSMEREFEAAMIVEAKLNEIRANERTIHTVERQIVDRPVYHNVCIDDDGLQLIKASATQDTSSLSAD
jgi:hypothetical protein